MCGRAPHRPDPPDRDHQGSRPGRPARRHDRPHPGRREALDAVLVQASVMYLVLGSVATTTTVVALGVQRRLFTADHRLLQVSSAPPAVEDGSALGGYRLPRLPCTTGDLVGRPARQIAPAVSPTKSLQRSNSMSTQSSWCGGCVRYRPCSASILEHRKFIDSHAVDG